MPTICRRPSCPGRHAGAADAYRHKHVRRLGKHVQKRTGFTSRRSLATCRHSRGPHPGETDLDVYALSNIFVRPYSFLPSKLECLAAIPDAMGNLTALCKPILYDNQIVGAIQASSSAGRPATRSSTAAAARTSRARSRRRSATAPISPCKRRLAKSVLVRRVRRGGLCMEAEVVTEPALGHLPRMRR